MRRVRWSGGRSAIRSISARWWGPTGFTNPVCELDFRVGGHWHNVMRAPDGVEYPVDVVFIEIVEPERIVYRNAPAKGEVWGDNPPPCSSAPSPSPKRTGQTTLTMRAEFDAAADRERVMKRGFIDGTLRELRQARGASRGGAMTGLFRVP